MEMSKKELWSGRFRKQLEPAAKRFSSSPEDALLLRYDIAGSIAHAMGLAKARLLTPSELDSIVGSLRSIYTGFSNQPEKLLSGEEDIHMAVEAELTRIDPELGPKLHTARSRNDQIALDLRLFVRDGLVQLASDLLELEETILDVAGKYRDAPLPGYTHTQRAQPVYLSHHMLAHFWRFSRDMHRVWSAFDSGDSNPLGAGALAGTSHRIDPSYTASLLGFSRTFENSLDASSERDVCLDTAFLSSMIAIHLSSVAEEIVLWSSSEFGYAVLPDELSTGSSLMPHKKNPDMAELVRGKTGTVVSQLLSMFMTMKGLLAGYSRDLQEIKRPLFTTMGEVSSMVHITSSLLSGIEFNTDKMAENASDKLTYSVEVVDELVRKGTPFRKAHSGVGEAVAAAAQTGEPLENVLQRVWPDIRLPAGPREAIELRSTPGGSSMRSVEEQMAAAADEMEAARRWIRSKGNAVAAVDRLLNE